MTTGIVSVFEMEGGISNWRYIRRLKSYAVVHELGLGRCLSDICIFEPDVYTAIGVEGGPSFEAI